MGILSGLMGNATEVDNNKMNQELSGVLTETEEVIQAFKVIRDTFVFTTKRLILIDKQGLTGKKVEYKSIPYRAISYFSVETAGHFDLDSELKIWVGSNPMPISKEFKKGTDIKSVQQTLARCILG